VKITLIILLSLLFSINLSAQIADNTESETVAVEQMYLAKGNGEGKAGEAAESFLTTDIPIYCVVDLTSTKPAIVKMNLVAVSVSGVKAESKVITVTYKTNGKQNRVNFTGKPEGVWAAGNYRIDIFIDGKLATGQSFEIKKSPSEIQKTVTQTESFVEPKPKPKLVKQRRKN